MEFMPQFAPLVLLVFLGTGFALGVTGLVCVSGHLRQRLAVWLAGSSPK